MAIKLVDIKETPKEVKERLKSRERGYFPSSDKPRYPYGLKICLENSEIDRVLGASDLDVDDMVTISARGVVVSKRVSAELGLKEDRCLEIQITKLGLSKGEEKEDMRAYAARRNKERKAK